MGLFGRKKDVDVVDLSDMQKRGLIEKPLPEANDGVVDFSSSETFDNSKNANMKPSSNATTSAGDFLSSLAGAGVSNMRESPGPVTSSLREARKRNFDHAAANELRLKVDDNEFKINQLTEKIKELEMKLREKGL